MAESADGGGGGVESEFRRHKKTLCSIQFMFQIELYTKILTELEVQKTIDLLLEGQDWFLSKEIWARPMSSSATSTSSQSLSCSQSVSCMGR